MDEFIEQVEEMTTSINVTETKKTFSATSMTNKNNYNIKEQLDQLIGPSDFNRRLEKVNLTIGIIVSSILLLFFFL